MSRNNKRRKNPKNQSARPEDYNLKQSLGKLRQSQGGNLSSTETGYNAEYSSRKINSSKLSTDMQESTGFIMQIHESMNSRYDNLKDDITCVSDKINTSICSLRSEIENKLDKKLNEKLFHGLFYGAISVIVVMASLIYLFSYSGLVQDNKETKDLINKVTPRLENNEKSIKLIEDKIKDIEKNREKENTKN